MPVTWKLEYDGTTKTLGAWGVRSAHLTFRSLDVDELTLWIPRANVLAEPAFTYGAAIILWRDGVRWFSGVVLKSAAEGGSRTEGDRYTIAGPWWQLSRLVYQQPRCVSGASEVTPRVTLGQNRFGQRISVGRQIAEIVTYALTKALPVTTGALPAYDQAWLEEASDLTCAGAIRKLLRFLPQAAGWFDYSASVPVLHIQLRELLSAVSLDATAGDTIAEFAGLTPRSDLVPAGVTLIFEATERSDEGSGGDGRTRTTITRQTAGITDGIGSIVAVVPLRDDEAVPAALALKYYTALQTAVWEGTIRTLEEDCTGTLRPGKVVNITNGRAAWATMRAVIQSVTEDLLGGLTEATLGAPEHLAPQDFVELQQLARRRHERTAFPHVQPCLVADPAGDQGDPEEGEEPETIDNEDAGIDPESYAAEQDAQNTPKTDAFLELMGSVDLEGCVDGQTVCVRVVGATMVCP